MNIPGHEKRKGHPRTGGDPVVEEVIVRRKLHAIPAQAGIHIPACAGMTGLDPCLFRTQQTIPFLKNGIHVLLQNLQHKRLVLNLRPSA
jgi:hypothetical protein